MKKILALVIALNIQSSDNINQISNEKPQKLLSMNSLDRSEAFMDLFLEEPDFIRKLNILHATDSTLNYLGNYFSRENESKKDKAMSSLLKHLKNGNFIVIPETKNSKEVVIVGRNSIPAEYRKMQFVCNNSALMQKSKSK